MNNNGPLLSSIAENDVNASFGTAMFQSYDESLGVSNIAGNSSLHHSKPDTLINIVDAECSNSAMLQSACNQSREEK